MSKIVAKFNKSGRFAERRLEESLCLFDKLSGETHLISPESLVLVELLLDFTGMRESIANRAAGHFDGTEQEIQNFIDRTMSNLQDIGFLEVEESS